MASAAARRRVADGMASAAQALLEDLDETQRQDCLWPFPSDGERRRWFYTPTDHGGLALGAMTPRQRGRATKLLARGLSFGGFATATAIMALEDVLDEVERPDALTRYRDPTAYQVRLFGQPDVGVTWAWRFGGHHVSVHHTIVDGEVQASTPCFFGANPASTPLLGPHPHRPLGAVEDLARRLVQSLDDVQRRAAVLAPVPPPDIAGGNRSSLRDGDGFLPLSSLFREPPEGAGQERLEEAQRVLEAGLGLTTADVEAVRFTARPKGVRWAALGADQQELLLELLGLYVGRLPDDLAAEEERKWSGPARDGLAFAWAGATEAGRPHYYRVQGARLLVEYDNVQGDGNHAHAVWRDPDGDFGDDVLARHHAEHHSGH